MTSFNASDRLSSLEDWEDALAGGNIWQKVERARHLLRFDSEGRVLNSGGVFIGSIMYVHCTKIIVP